VPPVQFISTTGLSMPMVESCKHYNLEVRKWKAIFKESQEG
jgi:hypothetical protein